LGSFDCWLVVSNAICYVNWGRYAQLAGQAVLPFALWFMWEAIESNNKNWRTIVFAGGAFSWNDIDVYRMPFYYFTFILSWMMGWGLPRWKLDIGRWLYSVSILAIVCGVAFFLCCHGNPCYKGIWRTQL
jgi:hypothetical protein